jgi:hypothetical protein
MKKLAGKKTAPIPFTAENVLRAVARETKTKETDLEAEVIESGICFEVRANGESDLGGNAQVWVLRDRAAAEHRAMELVLDDLCEGIDVLIHGSFSEESVFDALMEEAKLSDLRPWITSKVRESHHVLSWRTARDFWHDWRMCGLKSVARRPPGSGTKNISRKEHLRLQWAMWERDIDEIMSDRKRMEDFMFEESGDWENVCWLLSRQCRFDRDKLARRLMVAAGGPEKVFIVQEMQEGFMLEGL